MITPEIEKITDEFFECPYDALRKIREYCAERSCSACPYGNINNYNKKIWSEDKCGFTQSELYPEKWRVKKWKP